MYCYSIPGSRLFKSKIKKISISSFYGLNLSVSGALKTKKNWAIFSPPSFPIPNSLYSYALIS